MADRTWMDDVIETSNACLPNTIRHSMDAEAGYLTIEKLRAAIEKCIQAQFEPTIHFYPPGVLPEPEKHPIQVAYERGVFGEPGSGTAQRAALRQLGFEDDDD